MKHVIIAATSVFLFAACGTDLGTDLDPPAPGSTLRDVVVPEGFAFETSRSVELSVRAGSDVLPDGQGLVEIRRPNADVVYRGPIFADRENTVALALPTALGALEVELRSGASVRVTTVDVADVATIQF